MWFSLLVVFFFFCNNKIHSISGSLEIVNDDELLNLLRTEKYVVVLFTKNECELCDKHEDLLFQVREDLVDSLNAWVVKSVSSQLARLYSQHKEPAIVFFRHGIPLLYDGELEEELLVHTLTTSKEPCVRELNDDTFEHLTQASTGATTGDWFIQFHSTDCIDCQRLQARWEAVCSKLKTRLNVACINKQTVGRVTSRRLGVTEVPSFILFKHGKMYRYASDKLDITSLSTFAVESYKQARLETVPPPKTLLDDFVQMILESIIECSLIMKIIYLVTGVLLILLIAFNLRGKSSKGKKKSKDKRKKSK